jgi:hypothetical protein
VSWTWQAGYGALALSSTRPREGLAGGLVGAAGALFDAWLAFDAIQQQLGEENDRVREERQRQDQMQGRGA